MEKIAGKLLEAGRPLPSGHSGKPFCFIVNLEGVAQQDKDGVCLVKHQIGIDNRRSA